VVAPESVQEVVAWVEDWRREQEEEDRIFRGRM
jgi:hypothetical protein